MKRLRQAHSVKVQPNKTGTSFMQGQSVVLTKENIEKKGVVFNSGANTPYNDLSNNKIHFFFKKKKYRYINFNWWLYVITPMFCINNFKY